MLRSTGGYPQTVDVRGTGGDAVAWWWWLILIPIGWMALAIALGPIVGQWISGPRKKGK